MVDLSDKVAILDSCAYFKDVIKQGTAVIYFDIL